jgi:hypothetical protein
MYFVSMCESRRMKHAGIFLKKGWGKRENDGGYKFN